MEENEKMSKAQDVKEAIIETNKVPAEDSALDNQKERYHYLKKHVKQLRKQLKKVVKKLDKFQKAFRKAQKKKRENVEEIASKVATFEQERKFLKQAFKTAKRELKMSKTAA